MLQIGNASPRTYNLYNYLGSPYSEIIQKTSKTHKEQRGPRITIAKPFRTKKKTEPCAWLPAYLSTLPRALVTLSPSLSLPIYL